MKTQEFEIVIGFTPGYTSPPYDPHWGYHQILRVWQDVLARTARYGWPQPSGVLRVGTAVYLTERAGVRDEPVYTLAGTARDPERLADWGLAVNELATELRRELQQTTAYLTFREVDFHYLKGE